MEFQITTFPVLSSTQDAAHESARSSGPEGTVVQALEMTLGRGTHGRVWNAPAGNLYMSVVLRPDCPAKDIGQLSFVTAIAVARAIKTVLAQPEKLELKWPNDILIAERKICGILLESELVEDSVSYLVLGIGVNITHSPDEKATSLSAHTYQSLSIYHIRDAILDEIGNAYDLWKKQGFEPIREEWLKQAYRLGKEIKVSQRDGSKMSGQFINLDEQGYLVLSIDSTLKRISAGGIELES